MHTANTGQFNLSWLAISIIKAERSPQSQWPNYRITLNEFRFQEYPLIAKQANLNWDHDSCTVSFNSESKDKPSGESQLEDHQIERLFHDWCKLSNQDLASIAALHNTDEPLRLQQAYKHQLMRHQGWTSLQTRHRSTALRQRPSVTVN